MKKTLAYIAILAVLGFGIYYFIFRTDDNPFGRTEAGFNVKDTASVGKIYIVAADGEGVTVERKGPIWMLNGKEKALPSMVELTLNTLAGQRVIAPVTKAAFDNAVKLLASDAIKVEVYNRDGKKMTVFYVGGASANGNGTNMLMEGAKTPFIVQVPAFTGDLTARYSTRIRDWRDRTVFDVLSADIKSVSVQYADKPLNSFVLSREGSSYKILGDPMITENMGPLNVARANYYMAYFTNVNCEGYMNGLEGMDTVIQKTVKRCTIDLETVKGEKQHADIFWLPINRRSKNKQTANQDVPDEYDADRMYAIINNNKDTVMIQTLTFRKILRMSYEFFKKDEVRAETAPVPNNVIMHKPQ